MDPQRWLKVPILIRQEHLNSFIVPFQTSKLENWLVDTLRYKCKNLVPVSAKYIATSQINTKLSVR
jgi:hypothetical protein